MVGRPVLFIAAAGFLAILPEVGSAQGESAAFRPKRPGVAVGLSVAATTIPLLINYATRRGGTPVVGSLTAYGVFLGPSTGYMYIGQPGRVLKGGLVRLGISAVTIVGAMAFCGADPIHRCENEVAASALVLIGFGAFAWSAIHDIVSVGPATARRNAEQVAGRITVLPSVNPFSRSASVVLHFKF